jgi:dTDP-4-dehydrorhamnose reductase
LKLRILILGATGTVGRTLFNELKTETRWTVSGTTTSKINKLEFNQFRWPEDNPLDLIRVTKPNVIINLIAKLNYPWIEQNAIYKSEAILTNALLPAALNELSEHARMLHVSTNGVFSGKNHPYNENSLRDGQGVYAESKILGEINFKESLILRAAILGRSQNSNISIPNIIVQSAIKNPLDVPINEFWNGITVNAFAEIVKSILNQNGTNFENGVQHIIPRDVLSKYELFCAVAKKMNVDLSNIKPIEKESPLSQILSTNNSELLNDLWAQTSYRTSPFIRQMVEKVTF